MKLVGVNPTEPQSSLIKSLQDYLIKKNDPNLEERLEIAKGIFRRLPNYVAQESDLRTLETITNNAFELLTKISTSKEQVLSTDFKLHSENNQEQGYLIAITDRPFIVDTISEFLKEKDVEVSCFTHPLFQLESRGQISLTYFQINESNYQINLLENLKPFLDSLVIATSDFTDMLKKLDLAIENIKQSNDSLKEEISLFLSWLRHPGFIFLGYNYYSNSFSNHLGITKDLTNINLIKSIEENITFIKSDSRSIFCAKTLSRSLVHRSDYLDIISIKTNENEIHNFIGLFTSKIKNQEATAVPILRKKLAEVLTEEGLIPNSHDYKELISLANTLPKSDFVQYSKEQVRSYFHEVTNSQVQGTLKLIHIIDRLERFHYFTTVVPIERYSRSTVSTIERILRSSFTSVPDYLETHAVMGNHPLILIRTMVPINKNSKLNLPIEEIESKILEETTSWDERLLISLLNQLEEKKAIEILSFYTQAFSSSYKSSHSITQANNDITILEKLNPESPIDIAIEEHQSFESKNVYLIKIYKRGESLTLSNIVPYLENCGFSVLNEIIAPIASKGSVWATIYDIYVCPKNESLISKELAENILIPSLRKILDQKSSNDLLHSLLLRPGIALSQITILRTYVRYLSQIKITSSPRYAMEALIENPDIASLLIELFDAKFNPNNDKDSIPSHERLALISNLYQRILRTLKKVSNISHDRILASMLQAIDATLRTNYYIHKDPPYISIKIDCSRINNIPNPVPFREIFVSAQDFQGVHLRGGKIARGGLRWSSRKDDFRTEVLGLMKTQMVKNSIIVPVGAKGGFILHEEPTDRKELSKKVEVTYSKFIHALLDITDNRIGTEIKSPNNCICYDEHDPYFVVAADRGTATFSDLANSIASEEYNFWLGDAFASGGSVGYDHKKLGITAKGAWECAKRHFTDISLDIDSQEFTVIGIGDMSGDVFGNGLILSNNAKLIAAFDHRHIFIDPNPNSKTSFNERLRMFNLPTSSWEDYDKTLISKGGFVVSRLEKEVVLDEEIQKALGTEVKSCSTTELIQIILKAPADLLWNGGIGTYVKSSEEDHSKASDRTNDDVRIDAKDLRARVVAEGGNLGFTQAGRIEYSRIAGRINTDAVDNSGGVDMSDLEVNLKLLFREAILNNEITLEKRNSLLRACEEEACQKILSRNQSQSLVLSIATKRSRTYLNDCQELISLFEKQNRLSRVLEVLPSDEIFEKRRAAKAGLSRPELAVLTAHSKMWVFEMLIDSNIPEQENLRSYLTSYFPKTVSENFPLLLDKHPLKREIIATQIANSFVERMGSTFLLRLSKQTAASFQDIIRAYLVADAIFESQSTVTQTKVLDSTSTSKIYLSTLLRVQATLETMTKWFLDESLNDISVIKTISDYKLEFNKLMVSTDQILSASENNRYQESIRDLLIHGVPKELAKKISASHYSSIYLDIIKSAKHTTKDSIEIAKLYSTLSTELSIPLLIDFTNSFHSEDHWETVAVNTLAIKLRNCITNLCKSIISESSNIDQQSIENYFKKRSQLRDKYKETLNNLKLKNLSISSLFVLSNILDEMAVAMIKE